MVSVWGCQTSLEWVFERWDCIYSLSTEIFRSTCLLQTHLSMRSSSHNAGGAGDWALYKVARAACVFKSVYSAGCCFSYCYKVIAVVKITKNAWGLLLFFSPSFCCVLLLELYPTGIWAVFMNGTHFHSTFNLVELLCMFLGMSPLGCMSIPPVKVNLEFFVMWVLNLCRNELGRCLF